MSGFRENYAQFQALDAEILQISADPVPSLKAWAESLGGLPFPLLSDFWPHGSVGRAYGVFNDERGMDARSVFIVWPSLAKRMTADCQPWRRSAFSSANQSPSFRPVNPVAVFIRPGEVLRQDSASMRLVSICGHWGLGGGAWKS